MTAFVIGTIWNSSDIICYYYIEISIENNINKLNIKNRIEVFPILWWKWNCFVSRDRYAVLSVVLRIPTEYKEYAIIIYSQRKKDYRQDILLI